MAKREFYELKESDVGRPSISAFSRTWLASSFIGRVLPGDVGKRCYVVDRWRPGAFLVVESDEQRDKRRAGERGAELLAFARRLVDLHGDAQRLGLVHVARELAAGLAFLGAAQEFGGDRV